MKKYLIVFLLLSSEFLFVSCSLSNKLHKNVKICEQSVLGVDYNSILFKTNIQVFKNNISGLVLLKKTEQDSSVHVVFMSEFGLTLLDMKYKNDNFEVFSSKEFFTNERMINLLKNDFRVILQDFKYIDDYRIKNINDGEKKLKFSHMSDKFSYFYKPEFYVYKINKSNLLFKTLIVQITRNSSNQPSNIQMKHVGLKLLINLELIKLK